MKRLIFVFFVLLSFLTPLVASEETDKVYVYRSWFKTWEFPKGSAWDLILSKQPPIQEIGAMQVGLKIEMLMKGKTKFWIMIGIKEENIFFDQGKIYLLIEGSYFEIHTLMSDQGGIYVSPKELKWPYTPFICPNCDTLNGPGARYCKKCGAPRPD